VAAAVTTAEHAVADLAKLSHSLRNLWNEIEAQDSTRPLSRAFTMNFVGVVDEADAPSFREAFARVVLRHPCRAFLVELQDDGFGLSARVAAEAKTEGLGRRTVLEEITLAVDGPQFARVPGLIRPLLINDIPTHLFWARRLPDNAWALSTMARLVDQVIVDSALFARPVEDLRRLRSLANVKATDLTWLRLRPWRRALAEAFERVPYDEATPTTATIVHGEAAGARAAAATLRDWLATKLRATVTLHSAGASDPGMAELWPCRIEVEHGDAQIVVHHAPPRLRLDVTLANHCLLPYFTAVSRGTRGDLLAAAIDQY
jgi:hypothetical protein